MMPVQEHVLDEIHRLVAAIEDPEMPPLTLEDLGILRHVAQVGDQIVVTITPTYSGCPAVEVIEAMAIEAVTAAGHDDVRIERSLHPAWSTTWVTAAGRAKLASVGIAPPRPVIVQIGAGADKGPRLEPADPPPCPRCGSAETELINRFGATACKALHRCRSCSEPFDHFKELV